jgi:hypothetical protein
MHIKGDSPCEYPHIDPDFSKATTTSPAAKVPLSDTYASLYKESDSVSTFRPVTPAVEVNSQPSSSFTPRVVSAVPEVSDGSDNVSRLSDMDSRMSSLEARFQSFHTGLQELK